MNSIGETLRRERARQGLDLQSISARTKIGTRMLQAMEAGDFAKLPGGVFTRSFIRQYAASLGMDAASIEAELRDLRTEPETVPPPVERVPFSDRPVSSSPAVTSAVWVLLAIVCLLGVYYLTRGAESPAESTKAPRETTSAAVSRPSAPAAIPAPSSPGVPAPPAAAAAVRVVLSASESAWVSISVDGKPNFTGTLQPKERREFNAAEKVKVTAGNAGALDISLNGKNIEPLGPKGQVRTVELTRAGAQVISRAPKSEPLF